MLYYTLPYLDYTIYHTIPYHTILYYTILYYTILYYPLPQPHVLWWGVAATTIRPITPIPLLGRWRTWRFGRLRIANPTLYHCCCYYYYYYYYYVLDMMSLIVIQL